jgi:hypothetical protein
MMPRFRTASVIYICLVLGSLSAIAYSQPKVDNPKKDVCAEKNELTDRESILKSFAPNDPRWSRALIKQGLIYVRESEQWRRVITTERGSAEKIAADTDFVAALDIYCDLLNLSRKGESKKLRTPEEEERDNIAAARADAASRKARAMAGKTDDRFIPTATSPDSVIPAMPAATNCETICATLATCDQAEPSKGTPLAFKCSRLKNNSGQCSCPL